MNSSHSISGELAFLDGGEGDRSDPDFPEKEGGIVLDLTDDTAQRLGLAGHGGGDNKVSFGVTAVGRRHLRCSSPF